MAKVFKPGLLSIIGTAAPFGISWFALTSTETSQTGSVGPPIVGLIIGLGAGFAALILLAFSIVLFVDVNHHRIWGPIVAFLYGLGYVIVLILISIASAPDLLTAFLGATGLATYALGFVGGIWGFFAGTSWTPLGAGKGLIGSTGRIFFGGLVMLISEATIGGILTLIAVVLMLGPLWLHVGSRRLGTVGASLLGLSLVNGLFWPIDLLYLYRTFGGLAGYDSEVPNMVAAVLGSVLAGSGAIRFARRKPTDMPNMRPV